MQPHRTTPPHHVAKAHAWGFDDLKPLSKKGNNWLGLGLTIIDSLDVLWITSLHDEFEEATEFIETLVMTGHNATVQLSGVNL